MLMLKNWIIPLVLAAFRVSLAAEPVVLSVRITDNSTGEPVGDARVIVNHGAAAKPSSADMVQENRQFRPKSLVVARGSEVNFPNRDTTQHHVYSFSPAKVFNLELFADQPEAPILFDKTGVVEIGCNIHDQMQAFILVTDSALTARTDGSGMATISMPADTANSGELSLSLWHQRLSNPARALDFTISFPASDPVELMLDLAPERKETGRLDGLQKRYRDL
jgi:plastocyanin